MNICGLYQINKYHWMLYPSMEIASDDASGAAHQELLDASEEAAYWSNRLNCNVFYVSPNSMFMLLEQTDKVCKILTTNGEIGWIFYPEDAEWSNGCIEENPFTSPEPCDRVET